MRHRRGMAIYTRYCKRKFPEMHAVFYVSAPIYFPPMARDARGICILIALRVSRFLLGALGSVQGDAFDACLHYPRNV